MEKAVSVARDDLSSIRTGRANPGMFSRVKIDYYGSPTPITQLSSINVPRRGWSSSSPTSQRSCATIEDAIRNSDLGVNPTNDGNVIRVAIPQLTEERRRDLVKQAKAKGEDARVTGAQHPPQGDGGAAPHQEGRRSRRGRGRAAPRRTSTRPRTSTPPRSTSWSSTKKANCWRSSDRSAKRVTWQTPRPPSRPRKPPGVTCPPPLASASCWAGWRSASAVRAHRMAPVLGGYHPDRHPRGHSAAARGRLRPPVRFRCWSAARP